MEDTLAGVPGSEHWPPDAEEEIRKAAKYLAELVHCKADYRRRAAMDVWTRLDWLQPWILQGLRELADVMMFNHVAGHLIRAKEGHAIRA